MKTKAETLHSKALQISKSFRELESDLLETLIQIDTCRAYKKLGYSSLYQYVTQALKLAEGTAYNFITVARKAIEVPELQVEVSKGNLSISQARRIVPVLKPHNKEKWLPMAITLTQRGLEKEVASENPKTLTPERSKYVSKNRLNLNFGVSEVIFEKLQTAQDLVSQKSKKAASLEETLESLLDLYLERKDPVLKAKRNNHKPHKPQPINRNLTSLTRVRRALPAKVLHQIHLRDQRRCQFKDEQNKVCQSSRFIDIHHIKPVAKGGTDHIENLLTVCKFHHTVLHGRYG